MGYSIFIDDEWVGDLSTGAWCLLSDWLGSLPPSGYSALVSLSAWSLSTETHAVEKRLIRALTTQHLDADQASLAEELLEAVRAHPNSSVLMISDGCKVPLPRYFSLELGSGEFEVLSHQDWEKFLGWLRSVPADRFSALAEISTALVSSDLDRLEEELTSAVEAYPEPSEGPASLRRLLERRAEGETLAITESPAELPDGISVTRCQGMTTRGNRCQNRAKPGVVFCYLHDPARRAHAASSGYTERSNL